MSEIKIIELPPYEVAYIRRVGSYFEPQDHWGRLVTWSISNGLFPPQQHFIGISLDNPEHEESQNCRHDACVTIPHHFDKESHVEMQFKVLPGGQFALYSFYDSVEEFNGAYQYVYNQWLPNSQYEVDDKRYALEFNLNNPEEDPDRKAKVDLYIPIRSY